MPDNLSYDVVQTDDEMTSCVTAMITPKDDTTPVISIEYSKGFGVCGTGLKTKTIDFNDYSASQGFYDGNAMWSFISLHDDYEGCVIKMLDDNLFIHYNNEMNTILDTLHFRKFEGTAITENSANEETTIEAIDSKILESDGVIEPMDKEELDSKLSALYEGMSIDEVSLLFRKEPFYVKESNCDIFEYYCGDVTISLWGSELWQAIVQYADSSDVILGNELPLS